MRGDAHEQGIGRRAAEMHGRLVADAQDRALETHTVM
jgi:hypothetical protein